MVFFKVLATAYLRKARTYRQERFHVHVRGHLGSQMWTNIDRYRQIWTDNLKCQCFSHVSGRKSLKRLLSFFMVWERLHVSVTGLLHDCFFSSWIASRSYKNYRYAFLQCQFRFFDTALVEAPLVAVVAFLPPQADSAYFVWVFFREKLSRDGVFRLIKSGCTHLLLSVHDFRLHSYIYIYIYIYCKASPLRPALRQSVSCQCNRSPEIASTTHF